MSSREILVVSDLTKVFQPQRFLFSRKGIKKTFTAVDHVTFALKEGEILGLLGPNGAGKTTTIQMLLGILTPTCGSIHYFGKDFTTHRSDSLQLVTNASAYNKFPGSLTVQENLEIVGYLYGLSKKEVRDRIEECLKFFEIDDLRYKSARALSAGQITRVMLCKAFITRPRIVLLDEPTASLDPDIAADVRSFILEQQRQEGVSIILTSHNMKEVSEMCGRVLVMQKGRIIEEDTPYELARSISLSTLSLRIESEKDVVENFVKPTKLGYRWDGKALVVEMDENLIPSFLKNLTLAQIDYSHIDISKPSLEDYFLHISEKGE